MNVYSQHDTCKMTFSASYLIIILVHAGIISLQDEFLLEVHVTFIFDVFRESLFRAVRKKRKKGIFYNKLNTTSDCIAGILMLGKRGMSEILDLQDVEVLHRNMDMRDLCSRK